MRIEDVTPETVRPVRRSLLVQRWHDLTFLHWALPPAVVQPFLPRGTVADTLDGVTYAGLIGFRIVAVALETGAHAKTSGVVGIRRFLGQVQRMRWLDGRDGVLVDQLRLVIALQQHNE